MMNMFTLFLNMMKTEDQASNVLIKKVSSKCYATRLTNSICEISLHRVWESKVIVNIRLFNLTYINFVEQSKNLT